MSGAEWLSMSGMALDSAWTAFATLLTLVTGYLVAAYLVGKTLTKVQVIIVTAVFVFAALNCIWGDVGGVVSYVFAYSQATSLVPELPPNASGGQFAIIQEAILDVMILLASLKFMWDVRHPKKE